MTKVRFEYDPLDHIKISNKSRDKIDQLSSIEKKEMYDDFAEAILTGTLDMVGDQKSPVDGRKFKKLSKDYAQFKKAVYGTTKANLEAEGDMLDGLSVKRKGFKVISEVSGGEAPKADNHNKFSAKSLNTPVPKRRFIPNAKDGDKGYGKKINDVLKEIVEEHIDGD